MALSLVEFLAPLKRNSSQRDKCLAVLYFHHEYRGIDSLTVAEIKSALTSARIPNAKIINVANVMANAGALVDTSDSEGKGYRRWHLTDSGKQAVRRTLELPNEEPELPDQANDVSLLRTHASKVADDSVRGFIEEAILCLQVDARRAAIVFLWSGAVRELWTRAAAAGWPTVTAAVQKHDQRARPLTKIEDFAGIKDTTFLLAARELALIDKSEWTVLGHDLDLRNQCGHPTKFNPGPKKASAFIEDVLSIVFNA